MKSRTLAVWLAGASVVTLAGAACAQDAAPKDKQDEATVVVVTGSRVISTVAKSPTPITTVTNEALQATQPGTITGIGEVREGTPYAERVYDVDLDTGARHWGYPEQFTAIGEGVDA